MTDAERAALNAEYAVTCKGWCPNLIAVGINVHDYLSDEADAWRRVKALKPQVGSFGSVRMIRRDNGDTSLMIAVDGMHGEDDFRGSTLNEAVLRACVALKVRVQS